MSWIVVAERDALACLITKCLLRIVSMNAEIKTAHIARDAAATRHRKSSDTSGIHCYSCLTATPSMVL